MSAPRNLAALASGILFGAGLALSGMGNPAKVIGFLDVTGSWDPSLALVMVGALVPAVVAFRFERGGSRLLQRRAPDSPLPVTRGLVLGSLLFGVGWGLAGFCPGPAIMSLAFGNPKACLFAAAMLAGVLLHKVLLRPTKPDA